MSSDAKERWAEARMPCLKNVGEAFCAPNLARGAPYLAALPALICGALLFLVASGLVLAVYYDPAHGFASIQFIERNVNEGWLIRLFHDTGTTMLFGAVFLLLFRSLFTRGYKVPGDLVWLMQVKLFALLLAVAYFGYVLSNGAVSAWSLHGVTNATTLMRGLPGSLGRWIFGGPDGAGTLSRLVVFHAVLAVALLGVVFALRSATRAVTPKVAGGVGFHPYYTAQYFVAFAVFALIFAVLAFFLPHLGMNPLNAAAPDPLIVPGLLTAPWYLQPIDAIAGVFPGVYGGIFGVVAAIAVLAAQPWLDRSEAGARPGGLYRLLVIVLALDVAGLALSCSPMLTGLFTFWYFLHFLVLTPLVTAMEAK
ncbi:MAG TPA: cytochrome b N-terminal domain-containing protein [Acidocella sp.]|nr:MAG: hypothetical protein B7Z81_06540 [Acidocella sp. 20-61-6]HQT47456.1 cytochrome b N-terminal domain-containing protein [Acidocella sp.]